MKDLNYYKENADKDFLKTPISIIRYIKRLELEMHRTEVRVLDGIIARTITDQRVIEELEDLYIGRMQSDDFFGMVISASDVRERIHKLKQD